MDKLFSLRYTALRRAFIEQDFSTLNDRQQEAVCHTEGPLLILAGAGSGKTTVLINRIVALLKYGSGYMAETAPEGADDLDLRFLTDILTRTDDLTEEELERAVALCAVDPAEPWEILAITFTNKASGEIKDRLRASIGDAAADIWACTFHSACMRILRRYIDRMGYDRNFTVYDEDDKKRVISEILKDLNLDEKRFDPKGLSSEIGRAKDNLMDANAYQASAGPDLYKKTAAQIYQLYEKRLKTANALDFDDIIVKTVVLFKTEPDVLAYYQRKFRYILIDEYQDTNHAQYELTRLLAMGHNNLCVVGDDDQGIYRFRGATIQNILDFERTYKNAKVIRLEQNYRSTSSILNGANGVIAHNKGRKGKTLWTHNGEGKKIIAFTGETGEEEAFFIAAEILKEYTAGARLGEFAVLYRNNVLSNGLEKAFKQNGIPYRIISGTRFFDRAEIRDMLAYLWLIANPADDLRLKRIINVPPRKIGGKTLSTVSMLAEEQGISLYDVISRAEEIPELGRAAEPLNRFASMIEKLRTLSDQIPLPDLYEQLLEESGYISALSQKNDAESRKRIENVLELKSTVVDYSGRAEKPTLSGLLEEISLFTDIDKYDREAEAVAMLTIHAAKGLEFPYVFVCGMEEGVFPGFRSTESTEELEEERRLCYVAMTRAKKQLYLTTATRRMIYGQTRYSKPSRFIEEIPPECVEEKSSGLRNRAEFFSEGTPSVSPRTGALPRRPVYTYTGGVTAKAQTSSPPPSFRAGDTVEHKAFGQGMIVSVTPMGGDALVEIAFDKVGTKRLMAASAAKFMKKLN